MKFREADQIRHSRKANQARRESQFLTSDGRAIPGLKDRGERDIGTALSPKQWVKDRMDDVAPKIGDQSLSTKGNDNVNDLYRHATFAGFFARVLKSGDAARWLGQVNENVNGKNEVSTEMDLINNDLGIEAGINSTSDIEMVLRVMNAIAEGKGKIKESYRDYEYLRDSSPDDLPHIKNDKLEDRYMPGDDMPGDYGNDDSSETLYA